MPETRSIRVSGVDVRLQIAGDGPPIVSLHGAGGANWSTGLDRLAERFRVYLPEHPGFGETERPEWLETVQDLAVHYLELFDVLGLERVNLVGQSIGGWVAAELASLCSHHLRRLVLVDAAGLLLPDEERVDLFTLSPEDLLRLTYHDQALVERLLAVQPSPEAMQVAVRNRNMLARLGWNPYLSNPALRPRLGRIRVPTLIVWGAQDRLIPPTHAQAYASAIPNSRVCLIEACGHVPPTERPDEYARAVGEFLSEDDGRGA